MKLKCSFLSIVPILISILGMQGYKDIDENNLDTVIENTPIEVANFIKENFQLVVSEYNKESEEKWNASYIENQLPIIVDDCFSTFEGVYLDFNENYGYAIVGKDYTFCDFKIKGESPFKEIQSESYYYSTARGYMFLSDGEYKSVIEENNPKTDILDLQKNNTHYDGQEEYEIGCGKIFDTDQYIKSKYGDGWILNQKKSLDMYGNLQSNLSCYTNNIYDKNNGCCYSYSEGNCWIIGAYNIIEYMAKTKWTRMQSNNYKRLYFPKDEEPNLYSLYYDRNGNNISGIAQITSNGAIHYNYELNSNAIYFNNLYCEVRKFVNDTFKKTESGSVYETAKIINYMANKYGYSICFKSSIIWGLYSDCGFNSIDNGYPFMWCTSDASNGTYGNHIMAGCGYEIYSKTTSWWIFSFTSYKYFFELRDGHKNYPRFFDYSGFIGFGGIGFFC